MTTESNRKISLDFLRILSMCGIVGLHLFGQGGLMNNVIDKPLNHIIILFVYIILFLSVNIFGILSGYLCWNKTNNKNKRIVELISIVLFYSFIGTIIFYTLNLHDVRSGSYSIKSLVRFFLTGIEVSPTNANQIFYSLFPMVVKRYWYITCYILLFFLMPYLNIFIKKVSQKTLKKLIIMLFILLSVFPTIFFNVDYFRIESGYSPFWLIFCYLIGAYIGKYEKTINIKKKKIMAVFLTSMFSSYIINLIIRYGSKLLFGYMIGSTRFIDYVSPFNLISSVCVLLFFKDLTINFKYNNFIKRLSQCSFSVYIIHGQYLFYNYYFKDILKFAFNYNCFLILLIIIALIILIYHVCFIIDIIRIKIYKIIKIDDFNNFIGAKIDKITVIDEN